MSDVRPLFRALRKCQLLKVHSLKVLGGESGVVKKKWGGEEKMG